MPFTVDPEASPLSSAASLDARSRIELFAVALFPVLLASAAAAFTWQLYTNSLARHPDWIPTKANLRWHVMGAAAYQHDPMSLARNALDLRSWFGFQEVRFARALDLTEFAASVRFGADGYVVMLYDIDHDGFSGLRLSDRADLPSVRFRADRAGRFLAADTLPVARLPAPRTWHRVRLLFEGSRGRVLVDGAPLVAFDRRPAPTRVGFRGGWHEALVDDVDLRLRSGSTVHESFRHTRGVAGALLAGLLAVSTLTASGAYFAGRRSVAPRTIALGAATANLVLAACLGVAYVYQFARPRTYVTPAPSDKAAERQLMMTREDDVVAALQQQLVRASPDAYRILFLGSSQTWGAGAMTAEEVWVRQLDRLLNAAPAGRRVECLNAGVSALTAATAHAFLGRLWSLRPHAAVINLASNDIDPESLRVHLSRMVDTLMKAGVRTVLLLEANSPEVPGAVTVTGDLHVKHRIVREVAAAYGVPVIDTHAFLGERNGSGFLWWDFVHLTGYGQRLLAEKVAADLPPLLRLDGRAPTAAPRPRAS